MTPTVESPEVADSGRKSDDEAVAAEVESGQPKGEDVNLAGDFGALKQSPTNRWRVQER